MRTYSRHMARWIAKCFLRYSYRIGHSLLFRVSGLLDLVSLWYLLVLCYGPSYCSLGSCSYMSQGVWRHRLRDQGSVQIRMPTNRSWDSAWKRAVEFNVVYQNMEYQDNTITMELHGYVARRTKTLALPPKLSIWLPNSYLGIKCHTKLSALPFWK
jgi:hypothetical protein